ncbi:MAG: 4Fe-4S binding protein [Planctomycetota bacterium]|nr:MAG: 4Fe-4S binding protein [Planctomycetota bacterium]
MKKFRIRGWALARRFTALAFLALLVLGAQPENSWLHGSLTATRFLDSLRFADPLATLEVILASGHFYPSLLLSAALLLVIYALLGRAFCGWICPLGLLTDLADSVRTFLRRNLSRLGLRTPEFSTPTAWKYWLLAFFLALSFVSALPTFQILSPINWLAWALIFGGGVEWILLAAIVVVEFFSRRMWCRSLCPLGAFYSLVGRLAPWRVWIHPEKAGLVPCRKCTRGCPMGIAVMEDYSMAGKSSVSDSECTRCGACIDACPRGVLRLGFRSFELPKSEAFPV